MSDTFRGEVVRLFDESDWRIRILAGNGDEMMSIAVFATIEEAEVALMKWAAAQGAERQVLH